MRATDQTPKTEFRPREALFTPCGAKNSCQVIRLADEEAPLNTPPGTGETPSEDIAVKTRTETKKPSLYKVFLLNDDYTPMEFVVQVLETFFNKNREEATRVMMHVHRKGAGLCGAYPFDVAETKVAQVMLAARQAQHPLQCTMEKE